MLYDSNLVNSKIQTDINLQNFLNFLTDPVFLCIGGNICYLNSSALNLTGLDETNRMLYKPLDEVLRLHPSCKDKVEKAIARSVEENTSTIIKCGKVYGNGENLLDVNISISPYPYNNKNYTMMAIKNQVCNTDLIEEIITSKKEIEDELENAKKTYFQLINFLPDAVFLNRDHTVIFSNDAGLKLLGASSPEQIVNRNVLDFIHPDSQQIVSSRIDHIVKYRGALPLIGERIISLDGRILDVEVVSTTIYLMDEYVELVVIRDITEKKRSESELIESEERNRTLLEMLPDGVVVHDGSNIVFGNNVAAKFFGFERVDELEGLRILDFLPKGSDEELEETVKKIFNNEAGPVLSLHKIIGRDRQEAKFETTSRVFCFNNNRLIISVVRNITERLKIEELTRKAEENKRLLDEAREYDKLKTEFFANLSHEVRTPLNVILSSQQLLTMYVNNPVLMNSSLSKVNRHLQVMRQNCNRLLKLFNNLIDITRIDAGFFDLNLRNCNIVNVVEDVTLSVAEYIEDKGISLLFDTDIEEKVMAIDADKIERVMLNLLSNATKFTPKGGSIGVNLYEMDNNLVISVKDSGIGIPAEKLGSIFERFVQVDKSFRRAHEGSGIGLSIVKSLVELHNGKIEVKSEYGKGSQFIITLPEILSKDDCACLAEPEKGKVNPEIIQVEFSDVDVS